MRLTTSGEALVPRLFVAEQLYNPFIDTCVKIKIDQSLKEIEKQFELLTQGQRQYAKLLGDILYNKQRSTGNLQKELQLLEVRVR